MKALTIHQPYAHFIVTQQAELSECHTHKRVENRSWPTKYRGPLLIHAGKSRDRIPYYKGIEKEYTLAFGEIVGAVQVIDCINIERLCKPESVAYRSETQEKYPWFLDHPHSEGPFCFILDRAVKLDNPIPYVGRQGFFNVPDDLVSGVLQGWL